jgi:hypothetical protein
MGNIDETFEALKKAKYETIMKKLKETHDRPWIVNAMTFELTIVKPLHNIITGYGWTVEEFEHELNYRR